MRLRLFAADVSASAELDPDIEIEAFAAEDIAPEKAEAAPVLQHALQVIPEIGVFAAQIDEPLPRAKRMGGDGHAVEHKIGRLGQQNAILEGARFALVGVANDMVGRADRLSAQTPLKPGRETGAASAAELGLGYLLYDAFRRQGERGAHAIAAPALTKEDRTRLHEARRNPRLRQRSRRTVWTGKLRRRIGGSTPPKRRDDRRGVRRRKPRDDGPVDQGGRLLIGHADVARPFDCEVPVGRRAPDRGPRRNCESPRDFRRALHERDGGFR